jgi:serine/threonine protein kinase
MELCDGDLVKLFKLKQECLRTDHILTMDNVALKIQALYETSIGCEFIHKCGIVHFDLKCANVLFQKSSSNEYKFKICDFGVSI